MLRLNGVLLPVDEIEFWMHYSTRSKHEAWFGQKMCELAG